MLSLYLFISSFFNLQAGPAIFFNRPEVPALEPKRILYLLLRVIPLHVSTYHIRPILIAFSE